MLPFGRVNQINKILNMFKKLKFVKSSVKVWNCAGVSELPDSFNTLASIYFISLDLLRVKMIYFLLFSNLQFKFQMVALLLDFPQTVFN